MKHLSKYLSSFFILLISLFSIVPYQPVHGIVGASPKSAPTQDDPLGTDYGENTGLSDTDPRVIVGRIVQIFLGVLGIIALVLIVYGGFTIMTSAGNDEQVSKGKDILFYSVIGLVIILMAYSITNFLLDSLYQATTTTG